MQHLGTEDELKQVLRDLQATMSPAERLEGLSLEERLQGLSPEELNRLRQLLQTPRKTDNPSPPE